MHCFLCSSGGCVAAFPNHISQKFQPYFAANNDTYMLPVVHSEAAACGMRDVGAVLLRRGLIEMG